MPGGPYNLVDLIDLTEVSKAADSDGVCSVTFGPVPPTQVWRVGLINVQCNSTGLTPPEALVYVGDVQERFERSGTRSGNFDTADQSWAIIVPGNREFHIVWTGASVGAVGTASIQVEVYDRPPGGPPRRLLS